ncbi:MAG: dicarboxylate/amino acid:cation symporter [Myxococcota bacterium]|nr:dicarboxylate/amino acid:cation symporter [Myxococcota bacterium]
MTLHRKMLLAIVGGAGAGLLARTLFGGAPWLGWVVDNLANPLGQIFLRLLFMLVVPLLFSALVVGISDLDLKHIGRLGAKTLGYAFVFSLISVLIGLALVNLLQPGAGLGESVRELARSAPLVKAASAPVGGSAVQVLVNMFPDNPIKAAATGDMLGLIVFSLIFGAGLAFTPTPGAARLKEVIVGLYDVSMRLIDGVLKLAPYGVAALLFSMTARLGMDVLGQLAAYVGVVLLGLALQMFVVYPAAIQLLARRSAVAFFRDIRLAMVTAFSTASSNATLPTALKVAEENLRLPRHVSRFVLTAGSAMNQNGTALFEGVTVLFLAQLYGIDLSLGDQALVMAICVMAGIGTAGIPAGSIPVIAMILNMFSIPVEGLGLILGVDRFLDMCRTTLNVAGDLVAAAVVARSEPELPDHPEAPASAVG